ncbi:MAG TPA: hypothetical protein VK920_04895 [Solirubrobacterales bacterium]|nr:hypothetical protein [Solirubrobacterales bacterium]
MGVIGGSPAPMGSPARARAPGQRGRHELAVRAVHAVFGTDQTPDEHSWKLKKKQPKK